jgi:hypothetical protein
MAQQKETITNSLADVIQVIQLSRKSGMLTVERGEGETFEEGMITFVNGQAVEAQTTAFYGQNALRWLSGWGTCRFAFIPTPTSEIPSIPAFVSTPAFEQRMRDTGTHPRIPISPLRESAARRQAGNGRTGQVISFISASGVPHLVIPLEESLRHVDQLGLSRQHRRLLLLVDGQRNVAELERLIGRTQYGVQQLLADLEQAKIIRS